MSRLPRGARSAPGCTEKVCLDIADVVRDEPIILKNKIEERLSLRVNGGLQQAPGLRRYEDGRRQFS